MDYWMSNSRVSRASLGTIPTGGTGTHNPAEYVHWLHWSIGMSTGLLHVEWPSVPRDPGYYSLEALTQPSRTCSMAPLDPLVYWNVQWTFECQMAMLAAQSCVLPTGGYNTAQ